MVSVLSSYIHKLILLSPQCQILDGGSMPTSSPKPTASLKSLCLHNFVKYDSLKLLSQPESIAEFYMCNWRSSKGCVIPQTVSWSDTPTPNPEALPFPLTELRRAPSLPCSCPSCLLAPSPSKCLFSCTKFLIISQSPH